MMRFSKTLYGRLTLALLGLFLLTLFSLYYVVFKSYGRYQIEATQQVNRTLAANIIAESKLRAQTKISSKVWKKYLQAAMTSNPGIALYFVDPQGKILNFALHKELVVRQRIAISPVKQFLKPDAVLPIYGDDPQSPQAQQLFSAAPLIQQGRTVGYLYIVLNHKQALGSNHSPFGSFVFKSTLMTIAGIVLFALAVSLLVVKFITRRVESLSRSMSAFKNSSFRHAPTLTTRPASQRDEVDKLNALYHELAQLVMQRVTDLEQKDITRCELVSQLCHDIRTPLASLHASIEALQYPGDKRANTNTSAYSSVAAKQVMQISRMVDDLYLLSKLEDCRFTLKPEWLAIEELVLDAGQKFTHRLAAKQLTLQVRQPEQAMPRIEADISLIERLIDNLIDNAIKYARAKTTISIGFVANPSGVKLLFENSTQALSLEETQKLFQLFYRAPLSDHRQQSGSGLGLTICQRIVDLHQGNIQVAHPHDRGSPITQMHLSVSLPISQTTGQTPKVTDTLASVSRDTKPVSASL